MKNKYYFFICQITLFFCCNVTLDSQVISQKHKVDTIFNTSEIPFNKICHLTIKRNRIFKHNSEFYSTGFFISKNYILTAAHNIQSNSTSQVDRITIRIGRYKDKQLYKPITIKGKDNCQNLIQTNSHFKLVRKKRKWKFRNYDFGIIYIPDSLLPVNFYWNNEFMLDSLFSIKNPIQSTLAGYPGEKCKYSKNQELLILQNGIIEKKGEFRYKHSFNTCKGYSGSPVWITINNKNYLLGIHTLSKSGIFINDNNLKIIRSWMVD